MSIDITALLYLNPELSASGSATTHAETATLWDLDPSVRTLPRTLPSLPSGFDPRVYIASQQGVSLLNRTIKTAMMNMGMEESAVERQGMFVSSIMREVLLNDESEMSFRLEYPSATSGVQLGPGVLQAGDLVRLQSYMGRGSSHTMEGRVVSIDSDLFGFRLDPETRRRGPALMRDPTGGGAVGPLKMTLIGIKLWDPERQARVAYAREQALRSTGEASPYPYSATVTSNTKIDDMVPISDFDVQMYHSLYPETRSHTFSDTYIDYRARWRSGKDFRIKKASDIFNLRADYNSNSEGISSGPDLYIPAGGVLYAGSLTATPSSISVNGVASLGATSGTLPGSMQGFLVVSSDALWAGSNSSRGPLMTLDEGGNFSIRDGMSPPSVSLSADSRNVTLLDGAAAFSRTSASLLGQGTLSLSSNASVDILGGAVSIDHDGVLFGGRVGIGMPCTGNEGVSGWGDDISSDTKLAVDGNIYTTGTVISLSDPREKRDIRPIDDALSRVRRMGGYTYLMMNGRDPDRRHVGLLASEVALAIPEAVYTVPAPPSSSATSISSVAYGNLVGLLTSAVNQLLTRVEDLEEALAFNSTDQKSRRLTNER